MKHEIDLSRRAVLAGLAGVGSAAALGGASIMLPNTTRKILQSVSYWNDRTQHFLFDPYKSAQTYDASTITSPFPFNGFYPQSLAPNVDIDAWRLIVGGRTSKTLSMTVSDLRQLDSESQITRLICIEGWSAVGQWSGPSVRNLLERAQADLSSRYVEFHCSDGYWTSIDMASALRPQTIIALDFLGRPLPTAFGRPARLRIPTKLGFKNAKHIERVVVSNDWVGGYWEDKGYNWFAGL